MNTREELRVLTDHFCCGGRCPCEPYVYPLEDTASVHAQIYAHFEGYFE